MKKLLFVCFLILASPMSNAAEKVVADIVSFTIPESGDLVAQINSNDSNPIEGLLKTIGGTKTIASNPDTLELIEFLKEHGATMLPVSRKRFVLGQKEKASFISEIHYMKSSDNECYTLHTVEKEKSAGMWLETTITRPEGTKTYHMDCSIQVRIIQQREKIPNVNLDIGKPTFSSFSSIHSTDIEPGQWKQLGVVKISDSSNQNAQLLIILTRVLSN